MATKKNEYIAFSDLIFEVNKLTDAKSANGKDSSEYKKQHEKCVSVIKELNNTFSKGYASLSKARNVIQDLYIRDKAAKQKV